MILDCWCWWSTSKWGCCSCSGHQRWLWKRSSWGYPSIGCSTSSPWYIESLRHHYFEVYEKSSCWN